MCNPVHIQHSCSVEELRKNRQYMGLKNGLRIALNEVQHCRRVVFQGAFARGSPRRICHGPPVTEWTGSMESRVSTGSDTARTSGGCC